MIVIFRPGSDPSRVYYGTDTRAQTLLIGALLALVVAVTREARSRKVRVLIELAGIAGAVYTTWLITHVHDTANFLYRGGLTAVAVAVALVIAAATQPGGWILRPLLSLAPLRALGRISYGVYLFHWPIFLWLTPTRTGLFGWRLLALRTAVTIAASVASYLLIEMPVRRGTWRRAPRSTGRGGDR